MTVGTQDRVAAPELSPEPRRYPGRAARWWRSWRVCLRLARRDAWRDRWRSALVVLLIVAPVAIIAALDVGARTSQAGSASAYETLLGLGRVADARLTPHGIPVAQTTDGATVRELGSAPAAAPTGTPSVPAGWTLAPEIDVTATLASGTRAWSVPFTETDGRTPMAAGRYDVQDGRLAAGPGEVTLSTGLADAAGLHVGSTVEVRAGGGAPVQLHVVGIADPLDRVARVPSAQAAPGAVDVKALPADQVLRSWLVDSPAPLSVGRRARRERERVGAAGTDGPGRPTGVLRPVAGVR